MASDAVLRMTVIGRPVVAASGLKDLVTTRSSPPRWNGAALGMTLGALQKRRVPAM
jgi:hypothetical protein